MRISRTEVLLITLLIETVALTACQPYWLGTSFLHSSRALVPVIQLVVFHGSYGNAPQSHANVLKNHPHCIA